MYNNLTNRIIVECNKFPNATCDSEIKNIEMHQLRSKQMSEYIAQDHSMRKRRWAFVVAAARVVAVRVLAVSAVSVVFKCNYLLGNVKKCTGRTRIQ